MQPIVINCLRQIEQSVDAKFLNKPFTSGYTLAVKYVLKQLNEKIRTSFNSNAEAGYTINFNQKPLSILRCIRDFYT